MRKGLFLLFLFVSVSVSYNVAAQVSLTNASPSILIDFSNTTPSTVGSTPTTAYSAAGFSPNPTTAGRLNSNAWAVTGWNDGSLAYGGTQAFTTTDYTRGATAVSVTTGGFYAFTGTPASAANPTFMIQPGNGDFAPGTITLRVQNNGSDAITQIAVSYNLYIRNDQARSNSFNLSYSADDVSYTNVVPLDYASPATADALGWVIVGTAPSRNTTITGLNISPGGYIYLRWYSNDVSGTGARDEFGIDDINVSATFTPVSTDYYRTVSNGNWSDIAVWETSSDNITWGAALLPPTAFARTISVMNGHTVTISSSTSADQIVIQNGGNLIFLSGTLTLEDGAGDDIDIQNGGVFTLAQASTAPSYAVGSPTVKINTGGILRVSAAGLTGQNAGVNANNFVYEHQSILEYTLTGGFSTDNVIFFPNVNNSTIPIFRTVANSPTVLLVGASTPTIFNGVFDCGGTATIRWQNNGNRTFRNGITGQGNMDFEVASVINGKFIVNGTSAELGGAGTITVPPGGLEIGANTNVSMTSDKAIFGNATILANSFIELGTHSLTVSGSITGGSATSYIKTNGSGALILGNVTATRQAPIGNSTYNPLTITNTSGHNWSLRVEDALQVSNPVFAGNIPGAVQREWHITPSVNPPLTGADIVFEYDDNPLASPRQTGLAFNNTENVQTWHEIFYVPTGTYEWLAAGNAQPPTGTPGGTRTVKIFNWSWFSPFAISNISAPLPIKLTRFDAVKQTASRAMISWELAACCSKEARFELEKSTDGRNYILLATLTGSETSRLYSYADNQLSAGITYYRLKATDADGKVTYSPVATVINTDSGMLTVSVMPNPVGEQAVLSVKAAKRETVQFSIISSSGLLVRQWQQTVVMGTQAANIDLQALPAGIYQLVCQGQAERAAVRFIKH